MDHIRLLLDMSEVLRLFPFVTQTLLMTMQHDIVLVDAIGYLRLVGKIDNLGKVTHRTDRLSLIQSTGNLHDSLLPHTIRDEVGRSITQDTATQRVLPVVVMRQSAQGSLDAP